MRQNTAAAPTPPTTTPSLDPLVAMMAADMARVNATIMARMNSDVPLIPQLAGHLIAAGGKRLRPLLTLAGAHMVTAAHSKTDTNTAGGAPDTNAATGTVEGTVEGTTEGAIKLATAVEFIHSATLLHDDVIDESNLRRGRDTANALWGNEASVLVGDFLFARAFELMVEAGSLTVLGRLSGAAADITEGEIKQMAITGEPRTVLADYLDVITGKTAILFAAAAASGAEVAGGSADDVAALHEYGLNLGMAFQIMDDALDYSADASAMGKNAGDDFVDQKITMPVILAWQDGSDEERIFWQRTLGDADFGEGADGLAADLAMAQDILARHDAINRALQAAGAYVEAAIAAIAPYRTAESATHELAEALAAAAAFAAARKS